jgi:hypothetical protein
VIGRDVAIVTARRGPARNNAVAAPGEAMNELQLPSLRRRLAHKCGHLPNTVAAD